MIDPENRTEVQAETPEETGRKLSVSNPRCPNCGWQDTRPSRSKGVVDAILGMLTMHPYRCRSCSHRFHRSRRSDED